MKKILHTLSTVSVCLLLLLVSLLVINKNPVLADDKEEGNRDDDFVADELIVKYKRDSEPFRVVKIKAGKPVRDAEREFESRDDVVYAEPNYIARAFFVPNDPYYSLQWHFDNVTYGGIQTQAAWDVSTGSGVAVAVIDTGIAFENYRDQRTGKRYYRAPDLASTCFAPGYDFVENDSHPNDDNSHGTHVAGTIAQSTDNGIGVAGVAFSSCLQPIKVLDRNGSGTYSNVAKGIRFAADNGTKIINLSLGGPASSQTLLDAVAYAYNKGVTIVAAAGNDGTNVVAYPAAYDDYVMAVGASRYDETLTNYSNFGPSLDLAAPGGDLTVDQNNDGYGDGVLQNTFNPNTKQTNSFGYWFFQGTSMAAPHVSGVAALVVSKGNAALPGDVRKALETTAEDLGAPGRDDKYGYGLVNAAAALGWTPGPVDNQPSISITNPVAGATVVGLVDFVANATDDKGVIRVDFFVDTALLNSDTTAPYGVVWDSTTVADGNHTLKATAVDTASQNSSATITVQVDNINSLPVANAGPDKSATVNSSVTFDGSASFDPDGTIVSYVWDFGDGTGGNGVTTSHVYTLTGTYVVTLTVADNRGAPSQDTAQVVVSEAPNLNIVIERIDTRDTSPGEGYYVRAYLKNNDSASYQVTGHLTITDSAGVPVSWPGMEDKTTTISAGSTSSIRWRDTVSSSASQGIYTAKVDILYQGAVVNSASNTFVVSGSSSSD